TPIRTSLRSFHSAVHVFSIGGASLLFLLVRFEIGLFEFCILGSLGVGCCLFCHWNPPLKMGLQWDHFVFTAKKVRNCERRSLFRATGTLLRASSTLLAVSGAALSACACMTCSAAM